MYAVVFIRELGIVLWAMSNPNGYIFYKKSYDSCHAIVELVGKLIVNNYDQFNSGERL
ncbi:hypothetical protein LASHA2_12760 [Lactiplantibacillus plantarum]